MSEVKDVLKTLVSAMQELEVAKDNCKDIVDAALEEYEVSGGKVSKKSLKKTAKALATAKFVSLDEETQELNALIEGLDNWQTIMVGN